MKLTLKERLVRYFKKNHATWVPSGELQRIVSQYTSYSPQNTGRRLRELENEGILEVKYVKGHAHYRAKRKADWQENHKIMMDWWDSVPDSITHPKE